MGVGTDNKHKAVNHANGDITRVNKTVMTRAVTRDGVCGILRKTIAWDLNLTGHSTRLAHDWASGELSYSENWFEKLSFAAACSLSPHKLASKN